MDLRTRDYVLVNGRSYRRRELDAGLGPRAVPAQPFGKSRCRTASYAAASLTTGAPGCWAAMLSSFSVFVVEGQRLVGDEAQDGAAAGAAGAQLDRRVVVRVDHEGPPVPGDPQHVAPVARSAWSPSRAATAASPAPRPGTCRRACWRTPPRGARFSTTRPPSRVPQALDAVGVRGLGDRPDGLRLDGAVLAGADGVHDSCSQRTSGRPSSNWRPTMWTCRTSPSPRLERLRRALDRRGRRDAAWAVAAGGQQVHDHQDGGHGGEHAAGPAAAPATQVGRHGALELEAVAVQASGQLVHRSSFTAERRRSARDTRSRAAAGRMRSDRATSS